MGPYYQNDQELHVSYLKTAHSQLWQPLKHEYVIILIINQS